MRKNTALQWAGLLLVLSLTVLAVRTLAPEFWSQAESVYREKTGWSEQAKKKDPVGYMEYVLDQAETELSNMQGYIQDYNHSIAQLIQEKSNSQKIVQVDTTLLQEMKTLYKKIEVGDGSWPVTYRERAYSEAEFRQQIGVLLSEKDSHSRIATNLQQEINHLKGRLNQLKVAKSKYKSKISRIRADIQIARARKGTKAIEAIIAKADQVLASVGSTRSDFGSPLRTAEEMAASGPNLAVDQDVNDFLNS